MDVATRRERYCEHCRSHQPQKGFHNHRCRRCLVAYLRTRDMERIAAALVKLIRQHGRETKTRIWEIIDGNSDL